MSDLIRYRNKTPVNLEHVEYVRKGATLSESMALHHIQFGMQSGSIVRWKFTRWKERDAVIEAIAATHALEIVI